MKHIKITLLLLCAIAGFCATVQAATSIDYFETIKNDPAIKVDGTYYMRHNLMYEKDTWDATNYWRGMLLPINTRVKVGSLGVNSMRIEWDGGSLLIENSAHTKRSMAMVAKQMLSPRRVPIEKFGDEMAGKIRGGILAKGMTREQVIMTRGFPPGHKTPNITSDEGKWTYWTSRFAKHTLAFKGGKLEKGRNLAH